MTTTKKADLEKLTADLKAAAKLAIESVDGVDDGGTCNFDAPVLVVARKSKKIEAAIEAAGGSFFHRHGGYVLSFGFPGQANRRTLAAEFMKRELAARGYTMSMHYAMD